MKLAGLGARDSLRLEAGLCLSGQDIDSTTSPIQAALSWTIPRRRREEGGFPGTSRVLDELAGGPSRLRVGLEIEDRIPARQGAPIFGADRTAIRLSPGRAAFDGAVTLLGATLVRAASDPEGL